MRGGAPSLIDCCILSGPISACCLGVSVFSDSSRFRNKSSTERKLSRTSFPFLLGHVEGGPCLGLAIVRCGPDDAAAKRAILVYGYTTTV